MHYLSRTADGGYLRPAIGTVVGARHISFWDEMNDCKLIAEEQRLIMSVKTEFAIGPIACTDYVAGL